MDYDLVERIRKEHPLPLIGVIGATNPTTQYKKEVGVSVGWILRDFIEISNGSIFTGGVNGVGIDVFAGITKWCIETGLKKGSLPPSKFFVLVPQFDESELEYFATSPHVLPKYVPPTTYNVLGVINSEGNLNVVYAGNSMQERREYVGIVPDYVVAINGGFGTLDEAFCSLKANKPVIVMPETGGAARTLIDIKNQLLPDKYKLEFIKHKINFDTIDTKLIMPVRNSTEFRQLLEQLGNLKQKSPNS